jgi:hypothetical protein
MARQSDRFVKVYSQGSSFTAIVQIWVDRETGVNYLWQSSGYGGGLDMKTALLALEKAHRR